MMDQVHGRPDGTAGRNFRENAGRLVDGRHFIRASSDEIRRNNPGAIPDALRRNDVVLLTERGYLVLVNVNRPGIGRVGSIVRFQIRLTADGWATAADRLPSFQATVRAMRW